MYTSNSIMKMDTNSNSLKIPMPILNVIHYYMIVMTLNQIILCRCIDTEHIVQAGISINMTCTKATSNSMIWDLESPSGAATTIAGDGILQTDPIVYALYVTAVGNPQEQTLQILGTSLATNGVFRCYSLFDTDYIKFNVTVLVPPDDVYLQLPSVNEGETLYPRCVSLASKPAPQISWIIRYHDGREVTPEGSIIETSNTNFTTTRTSYLVLTATKVENMALFICKISIDELDYTDTKQEKFYLNVIPDTPVLIGANPTIPIYSGLPHSIHCIANNGRPAATINWKWDGNVVNGVKAITNNNDGTFNVRSTLFIPRLSYHYDGSQLECGVVNDAMSNAVYLNGRFNVYSKPQISANWDVQSNTAYEGSTANFQCDLKSKPNATGSGWILNGETITGDSNHVIQDDIYLPNMQIISISSADKGSYQCYGINPVGTGYSDVLELQILHKPICKKFQLLKYAVKIGSYVNVECHVEAVPNTGLKFGWSTNTTDWIIKDGTPYLDDSNYAMSTFIYHVRDPIDYGNLNCKAANGMGSTLSPCVIEVSHPGPAEPPTGCEENNRTKDSLSVICHEVFRGGSSTTYTIQVVNSHGIYISLLQKHLPVFHLKNLLPLNNYSVRVCASNVDFSFREKCGEAFTVSTLNGTFDTTGNVIEMSIPEYVPYVAAFSILLLLVIGILVTIVCIVCVCKRQKKEKKEAVALARSYAENLTLDNFDPEGTSSVSMTRDEYDTSSTRSIQSNSSIKIHTETGEVSYTVSGGDSGIQEPKSHVDDADADFTIMSAENNNFENGAYEENIYDKADGLKDSIRESVIEAIRERGAMEEKEESG